MADDTGLENLQSIASATLGKRYKLLAQLGAGGMALVHLAIARGAAGAEKLVVLKSIRPDLVEDSKVLAMFVDEARLAVQLSHPNVVQTYDVVTFGVLPIIVMEYLEGQSLGKCIAGDLPLPLRLHALREVLAGLDYAHNIKALDGTPLGIVHRDMSPQNIIVTYDGHVKVLDFGIAKAMGQTPHTEMGEMKGKLRYMAPEQMIGKGRVDRRADAFSVGVMLWEALTGKKVWEGLSDVEVIQTVLESGIPTPRAIIPDIPAALERVCCTAIAEQPDGRYPTARAMQEELDAAMASLGHQVSVRDVALWMESTFAERRARIRAVIRSQMEQEHSRPVEIGTDASVMSPTTTQLAQASEPALMQTTRDSARRRYGLIAIGALLLIGGVSAGQAFRREPAALATTPVSSMEPPPAITQTAPVESASTAVPAEIDVHLAAIPKTARMFLDDEQIHNPYWVKRSTDEASHSLRVEARGYVSKTIELGAFRSPIDMTVALELQSVRQVVPAVVKPRPEAPAPPVPSKSQCESPFYRDADGIMRVKPECVH